MYGVVLATVTAMCGLWATVDNFLVSAGIVSVPENTLTGSDDKVRPYSADALYHGVGT